MPPRCHDRAVAAVERFGPDDYGATVRDAGHPGANAGWAGRSCSMCLERELVVGRPCDLSGGASSARRDVPWSATRRAATPAPLLGRPQLSDYMRNVGRLCALGVAFGMHGL